MPDARDPDGELRQEIDGPLDRRMVVVPLVRVRLTANGRTYRCRALPGQTVADYEAAVARLQARWSAVSVAVEHNPGERHVWIHVHRSAPAASTYRRRA